MCCCCLQACMLCWLQSLSRLRLPPPALLAAAAALLAQFPGAVSLLALVCWAAADLASAAWAALRTRPDLLQQLSAVRPGTGAVLQQAVDAEAALDSGTLALMRHALPAIPVLLLALALGEGRTLVRGEGCCARRSLLLLLLPGAAATRPVACVLRRLRPLLSPPLASLHHRPSWSCRYQLSPRSSCRCWP